MHCVMRTYRGNAVSTNENLYTPFYSIDWESHHKILDIRRGHARAPARLAREFFIAA